MEHKGWHSRHYLPHFDSPDVTQFVTFRLADSLPREALQRLEDARRPETMRHELLDQGYGSCWLKSEPIARLVEEAFLAFDGTRYRLHAWTVMPNHVHVLFTVLPGASLGAVVGSWKRFTAREANSSSDVQVPSGKPNTGIVTFGARCTSPLSKPTSIRIRSRRDSSRTLCSGHLAVRV